METQKAYGIFKVQEKKDRNTVFISNGPVVGSHTQARHTPGFKETELVVAHDIALPTEEEAVAKMETLPRPGMYVILPVYVLI